MARDRPSPYAKGMCFFHRSVGPVTATLSDLGNTLRIAIRSQTRQERGQLATEQPTVTAEFTLRI